MTLTEAELKDPTTAFCLFCKKPNTYGTFKAFLNEASHEYSLACLECYKAKKLHYAHQKPGWVYIMGFEGFWKVGFTTGNPITRLLAIQHANPQEITLLQAWFVGDCKIAEKFTHNKLAPFHFRGEWFKGSSVDLLGELNPLFRTARRYNSAVDSGVSVN